MKKIKKGFSLAEALMALLIVSLIVSAMIPVLTRKHRDVGIHGKWECTLNENGQHVSRMLVDGKFTDFEINGDGTSCSFAPPAGAENFTVKAIGGGGSGAGGIPGETTDTEKIAESQALPFTAPFTGKFSITLQGGGGGGGGMKCGNAQNYVAENFLAFDTSHRGSYENPGYIDAPDPSFDYSVLYSNDKSKYAPYLSGNYDYCFSQPGWTNAESDDDKCWNYPGQGGGAGETKTFTIDAHKGDLITVVPAREGLPGAEGGPGGNGDEACYIPPSGSKVCASGGGGGYNRYRINVSYNNVPVCRHNMIKSTCFSHWGPPYECGSDVCDDKGNCVYHPQTCQDPVYVPCIVEGPCIKETRNNYFSIPTCINETGGGSRIGMMAYQADLINTAIENGDEIGGAGSGGNGANRGTITEDADTDETNPDAIYNGEGASAGVAALKYVTYSGGSGGQAGGYAYSMFKKLPRVTNIKIGRGGHSVGIKSDGERGGDTEFGDLLKAAGGNGGRIMSNIPNIAKGETKAEGSNGDPSPLDSGILKGLLIAWGGFTTLNNSEHGYGAITFAQGIAASDTLSKLAGKLFIGSKKTEYTYGAGGGGGGGMVGKAGDGGAGAPGAVIIEW